MDNSYKLEAVIAAVSSTLSRRNEYDTDQVCRKVKNAVSQWPVSHNRKSNKDYCVGCWLWTILRFCLYVWAMLFS